MCATLGSVLRASLAAVVLLCVVLAATGCGSSSKPAVCSARDDLTKSVDTLINTNPVSDGVSGVKANLAAVRQQTTEFAKAAGDQFSPQIDAFKQSLTKVSADVQALTGSGDKASALGSLASDVSAVQTSWNALTDAVKTACD
jgi:predicted component of type VI protein secretion system